MFCSLSSKISKQVFMPVCEKQQNELKAAFSPKHTRTNTRNSAEITEKIARTTSFIIDAQSPT
jgi:hypothetical protein